MAQIDITDDDKEELFLSCRYGDLDDIRQFVDRHGKDCLDSLRDDNGNTFLHLASANGFTDILDYLLPLVSPSLLAAQNAAGSTALHWAALNAQLDVMRRLVEFPGGPGPALIDIKNSAGRSPLGEAEMAGFDEGARWLVEKMNLHVDDGGVNEEVRDDEEMDADQDEDGLVGDAKDIQIEIEGADGDIARLTIGSGK